MNKKSPTPKNNPTMTTNSGYPVGDNQNSLTVGAHGPVLLQDFLLIEKMAHQNRERIPERTVHAKGVGAYGELVITHDISKYTKAKALQKGTKTPMLARISTVAGERGAADAERDVRGFALKFYTEEGNWDLVGNNTPVFFVRDPMKFPDFIHTQKRHPKTHMKDNKAQWDFWSLVPESVHQVTILMSDRGLPISPRFVNGYGSHTYSLLNEKNERIWVKFHFHTLQGHRFWTNKEAEEVAGKTRESSQDDVYHAIENGDFPKWKMFIQVMTAEQAKAMPFNPFDLTKVWPHGDFPLIEVGYFELNKNPKNYFAEIEQSAFSPSNIVPGIGFSPDKMLQGRIMSYPDAHRYRIGTHFEHLPVNAAKVEVHTYNADGAMRFFPNVPNPDAYYEPNSFGGPKENPKYDEPPLPTEGEAWRYSPYDEKQDDYVQPRALFNLFNAEEKRRLFENIATAMEGVPQEIIDRQLGVFDKVSPDYAKGVKEALKKAAKPPKPSKGHESPKRIKV